MLPWPADTTCDIYRHGHAPPASPDVAAVSGHLVPCFERGREAGEGEADALRFTHVLHVESSIDVRDDFGEYSVTGNADTVYVPDQNGVPLLVVFVERVDRGGAQDHKRIYLDRKLPSWPLGAALCAGVSAGGITVNCCGQSLPALLHVTISNKTGGCACLPDALLLTWNVNRWEAGGAGFCATPDLSLTCAGSSVDDFVLAAPKCSINVNPDAGGSCNPLDLVFTAVTLSGCCAGTAKFHITE